MLLLSTHSAHSSLPPPPQRRDYHAFQAEFTKLLAAAESRAAEEKRQRSSGSTPGGGGKQAAGYSTPVVTSAPPHDGGDGGAPDELPGSRTAAEEAAFNLSRLSIRKKGASPALQPPGGASGSRSGQGKAAAGLKSGGGGATTSKKSGGKVMRTWDGSNPTEADPGQQLDFSDATGIGSPGEGVATPVATLGRSAMDVDDDASDDDAAGAAVDDEDDDGGIEHAGGDVEPRAGGQASGWFASVRKSTAVLSVLGKAALTRDDVAPMLEQLKLNLLKKNVASDIADKLCDSVARTLEGRRLASFTSLAATVRAAMEEALTRILTPQRGTDILRDVGVAREAGRLPYVIVFVGVNGVGKSTNLAKVAYWLTTNDKRVMIAACDTFRSGAVEQLRTHCTRLGVPLFEKGYAKDPAGVAGEAIKAASKAGCDVLLVDTAGRMQDNEPLMRALSKLINQNRPDLVLFVGEALVGNDAVDQLSKFNARLADLSSQAGQTRVIDGIVLTKFDTIDDKVGAALSMAYTSGAPIMFVGTGQTYTDLKRFNPKTVVKSLLR